jgi:hypothetical protein
VVVAYYATGANNVGAVILLALVVGIALFVLVRFMTKK